MQTNTVQTFCEGISLSAQKQFQATNLVASDNVAEQANYWMPARYNREFDSPAESDHLGMRFSNIRLRSHLSPCATVATSNANDRGRNTRT